MKLATFRVFIYSNMEHKINKIVKFIYQWKTQDLTINQIRLVSQYDDHERNYKQANYMCFSLILS